MIARCDYETRLSEQKASLEYERGGLGWFGKTRKREIDRELRDLSITELQMEIEDEKAQLQGALDPLQARLEALETELAAAPLTAFARKKALKAAIADLNEEIRIDKPDNHGHQVDGKDCGSSGQPGHREDQRICHGLNDSVLKLADPGKCIASCHQGNQQNHHKKETCKLQHTFQLGSLGQIIYSRYSDHQKDSPCSSGGFEIGTECF
jgi:hypothetical protein